MVSRVSRSLLLLLFSILIFMPAESASMAADFHDLYEAREFKVADVSLRYRLMKPLKVERGKRYPLVLFFHGAGECGDDNTKQLIHAMADFAKAANRCQYPCFVVAPQCPAGNKSLGAKSTALISGEEKPVLHAG